jgi:hypothetical protein
MRKTIIILYLLLIAGCKTPGNPPPVSRFDIAIENLSITSQKLDDLRMEKDIFVRLLDDFERQKAECGDLFDAIGIARETEAFAEWHRDITQREKDLTIEYSMNVLAAHRELAKRKNAKLNEFTLASPAGKP